MLLLNKQRMHFIVYLQSTFSGFRSGISPFLLSFVAPHWTLQWFSRIGFGPTYMLVVGKLDAIHLRSISQPDTATAFSQLNYYNMGAGVLAALTVTVLWEFVRTLYSPSNLYRHIKELRVFLLYGTLIATLEWAQVSQLLPQLNLSRLTVKPVRRRGGGEWGIRTPGTLPYNSFQDCHHKPLGQLSIRVITS